MNDEILCVGEILWDALPAGLFLGGAPFNVACHLHALGNEVHLVSRVGDDVLGREALRRLHDRGLSGDLVQIDDEVPTGFVRVSLDDRGVPGYEIVEPAAWDFIRATPEAVARASGASAIVFGTLAQRSMRSREALRELLRTDALKVIDLNLRPPYDDPAVIEWSLEVADVVKLSDGELDYLRDLLSLPVDPVNSLHALGERFSLDSVCVTAGADGATLWQQGNVFRHLGYNVRVQDTVGAGDAFLAALLTGLLRGVAGEELLDLANRLGAFVASQSGATPAYAIDGLRDILQLPLLQPHDAL
ncbi:MAG: carbohydrate kinase family protein [Bacteroidota bacterium]